MGCPLVALEIWLLSLAGGSHLISLFCEDLEPCKSKYSAYWAFLDEHPAFQSDVGFVAMRRFEGLLRLTRGVRQRSVGKCPG